MVGWAPPGKVSNPHRWVFDFSKGWLAPGQEGDRRGFQYEMDTDFDPSRRDMGWHALVSPPGTAAPPHRINYTPKTREVSAPGTQAPIDQTNLTLMPERNMNPSWREQVMALLGDELGGVGTGQGLEGTDPYSDDWRMASILNDTGGLHVGTGQSVDPKTTQGDGYVDEILSEDVPIPDTTPPVRGWAVTRTFADGRKQILYYERGKTEPTRTVDPSQQQGGGYKEALGRQTTPGNVADVVVDRQNNVIPGLVYVNGQVITDPNAARQARLPENSVLYHPVTKQPLAQVFNGQVVQFPKDPSGGPPEMIQTRDGVFLRDPATGKYDLAPGIPATPQRPPILNTKEGSFTPNPEDPTGPWIRVPGIPVPEAPPPRLHTGEEGTFREVNRSGAFEPAPGLPTPEPKITPVQPGTRLVQKGPDGKYVQIFEAPPGKEIRTVGDKLVLVDPVAGTSQVIDRADEQIRQIGHNIFIPAGKVVDIEGYGPNKGKWTRYGSAEPRAAQGVTPAPPTQGEIAPRAPAEPGSQVSTSQAPASQPAPSEPSMAPPDWRSLGPTTAQQNPDELERIARGFSEQGGLGAAPFVPPLDFSPWMVPAVEPPDPSLGFGQALEPPESVATRLPAPEQDMPPMPPKRGWNSPVEPSQVVGGGNKFGEAVSMEGTHMGTDLQAYKGTPAESPVTGTVVAVVNEPEGLGLQVWVEDPETGEVHKLCHLEDVLVQEGDQVEAGQLIARIGESGEGATGPHLDYRIMDQNGQPVDPEPRMGALAKLPPHPNTVGEGQGVYDWNDPEYDDWDTNDEGEVLFGPHWTPEKHGWVPGLTREQQARWDAYLEQEEAAHPEWAAESGDKAFDPAAMQDWQQQQRDEAAAAEAQAHYDRQRENAIQSVGGELAETKPFMLDVVQGWSAQGERKNPSENVYLPAGGYPSGGYNDPDPQDQGGAIFRNPSDTLPPQDWESPDPIADERELGATTHIAGRRDIFPPSSGPDPEEDREWDEAQRERWRVVQDATMRNRQNFSTPRVHELPPQGFEPVKGVDRTSGGFERSRELAPPRGFRAVVIGPGMTIFVPDFGGSRQTELPSSERVLGEGQDWRVGRGETADQIGADPYANEYFRLQQAQLDQRADQFKASLAQQRSGLQAQIQAANQQHKVNMMNARTAQEAQKETARHNAVTERLQAELMRVNEAISYAQMASSEDIARWQLESQERVQGTFAQRTQADLYKSALANPWLQQLSGMAPSYNTPGGPGDQMNTQGSVLRSVLTGWSPELNELKPPPAARFTQSARERNTGDRVDVDDALGEGQGVGNMLATNQTGWGAYAPLANRPPTPSWAEWLQMTPFERASWRMLSEAAEPWPQAQERLRSAWGQQGVFGMPGSTQLGMATRKPLEIAGMNQTVEAFGEKPEWHWAEQTKNWSKAAAPNVSLRT